MNPFAGMTPQEIASAVIIGSVLAFLTATIMFTYVRNAGWKVFGLLLFLVAGLAVLKLARG